MSREELCHRDTIPPRVEEWLLRTTLVRHSQQFAEYVVKMSHCPVYKLGVYLIQMNSTANHLCDIRGII